MRSRLALVVATVLTIGLLPGVSVGDEQVEAGASTELVHGWKIQSSAAATGTGAEISRPGYSTAGWLPISQPETLMAGLLENGRFPNIFFGENLKSDRSALRGARPVVTLSGWNVAPQTAAAPE